MKVWDVHLSRGATRVSELDARNFALMQELTTLKMAAEEANAGAFAGILNRVYEVR